MDYFNDLIAMFLSLDRVLGSLLSMGRVRELSECIKNILICVPKMNEGVTGLEQHETSLMTIINGQNLQFLGELSLNTLNPVEYIEQVHSV